MRSPVQFSAEVSPPARVERPVALTEPLERNAETAWRLAPDLCARASDDAPGCAWYHGAYPTLRLLGLVASPERHGRFFADALTRCAQAGDARVLVAGAADTAMLALVLTAWARVGAEPQVEMLDRCTTPLALCRDYAERAGTKLETRLLDLLDPRAQEQPAQSFDLICTHSLLAMLAPEVRPRAVAAWRAQLRLGGRVVSTLRIDPHGANPDAARARSAASELRARALESTARLRGVSFATPGEIADAAETYALRQPAWPAASPDELVALLAEGGFAIERLDLVDVPGRLPASGASAGVARPATYAEFVAVRG